MLLQPKGEKVASSQGTVTKPAMDQGDFLPSLLTLRQLATTNPLISIPDMRILYVRETHYMQ